MQLFVGLGNPGQEYDMNRHNIGFMAVDEIANANLFGPWRSKFQGQFCEGRLGNQKVIILKPSTFMNLSGQSVGELSRFYKINSQDIIVFHDELDLTPGKCRFKLSGGHAGHNGLKSIHSHIGENYKRIRLGIGHPGQKDLVSKYVLENFSKKEQQWLEKLLKKIAVEANRLANDDPEDFINQISLGSQNKDKNKKDKQSKDLKVATLSEKTSFQAGGGEMQKSTLQKLMDKFSRK